jgi:hypothetical protein
MLKYATRFSVGNIKELRNALQNKSVKSNRDLIESFKATILQEALTAHPDKSIINNMERMLYLYETYGFDKQFKTFKTLDKQFVCIYEGNVHVVVTCYEASSLDKLSRGKYRKHRF